MVRSDWECELTVPIEGHVEPVTVDLIDAAEVMGSSMWRKKTTGIRSRSVRLRGSRRGQIRKIYSCLAYKRKGQHCCTLRL
jgi:hypothetical protein